jgi:hypothetical protein
MLRKPAVEAPTLELIKSLQCKPYLQGFYLAGGTALALSLNHRRSIDIDLFSDVAFDIAILLDQIRQDFSFQLSFSASNTLKGSISGIKVDILAHRYKLLLDTVSIHGINMLSTPDIIAMKLNAISTSGQRSKDFIDIYYLLREFQLGQMIGFYLEKYDQENPVILLKSLIWFEDLDFSDWPVLIKEPGLKWTAIRKKLETEVLRYARNAV